MYAELNEGEEATAQDLLENVWPARGFPLPYLSWPLTWQEDPYHEAYWEFYFYGLRPEATLLYEWETTGRSAYREELIAILRSYVAYDATRPEDTVTFDNNHTSAYRTMELVNFYVKLKVAHALPSDLEAGLGALAAEAGGVPRRIAPFRGRLQPRLQRGCRPTAAGRQLPAHAGRERMADAGTGTLEGDARQHDRRRRRGGRELALLPGVRARARLPDRAVGQALRARAGDSLPASGDEDAALHRRCDDAQRLPADAGRHRHHLYAEPGPHRLRSDGRRRSRIRLRLHPRRPRYAAARRYGAVRSIRPLLDALAAGSGLQSPQPDVRHLQRRDLPHQSLRPRRDWGSRCTPMAPRCCRPLGCTPTPKNRASSTSTAPAPTTRWWSTGRTRRRGPPKPAATGPRKASPGRAG